MIYAIEGDQGLKIRRITGEWLSGVHSCHAKIAEPKTH